MTCIVIKYIDITLKIWHLSIGADRPYCSAPRLNLHIICSGFLDVITICHC